MNELQPAVADLLRIAPVLDDSVDHVALDAASAALDKITVPLSEGDTRALVSCLPANGDTAFGLNLTMLHAIESSDHWPCWDLLDNPDHEWVQILRIRLVNAGIVRPEGTE